MDHSNGQLQPYKLANTDINKQIWNLNREKKTYSKREAKNANLWRNVKYMIRRWQRLLYDVLMLANGSPYSATASPFVVKCDKHPCWVFDIFLIHIQIKLIEKN